MSRKYSGRTDALCCSQSFAFASFISKNPSSLSVDRLNATSIRSVQPHWLQPHPVACTTNNPIVCKRTLKWGCNIFVEGVFTILNCTVTSIPCASSAESFLLQILRNSSRSPSVLNAQCYFLCQAWQLWACFLASVQYAYCHAGAFGGVVGSRDCCCHPFAACTHQKNTLAIQ